MATHFEFANDGSMAVGRVFALAVGTIRSNPVLTLIIALLFGTAPQMLLSYATAWFEANDSINTSSFFLAVMLASLVLGLAIQVITQAVLTRATVTQSQRRKASFGKSVSAVFNVALPLFCLAMIVGLATTVGSILLIVPGVLIYVIWAVAAPALVEERQGIFAALARSAELTAGSRWKVFGVSAVLIVAGGLPTMGLEAAFGAPKAIDSFASPIYMLTAGVATTLAGALSGTVQAAMYVDLSTLKHGPSTTRLAEVFA